MNEEEIQRDLPKLYEKVSLCHKAILDFERNIMVEEKSISELEKYIDLDTDRTSSGKKARFDSESMLVNVQRHKDNISLFKEYIEKETLHIEKFEEIIEILKVDLARKPEHIELNAR